MQTISASKLCKAWYHLISKNVNRQRNKKEVLFLSQTSLYVLYSWLWLFCTQTTYSPYHYSEFTFRFPALFPLLFICVTLQLTWKFYWFKWVLNCCTCQPNAPTTLHLVCQFVIDCSEVDASLWSPLLGKWASHDPLTRFTFLFLWFYGRFPLLILMSGICRDSRLKYIKLWTVFKIQNG